MFIKRQLSNKLRHLAKQFPIVGITGPRQSGKTTLAQDVFHNYAYVSLEDFDRRAEAQEDPRRFFAAYDREEGLIIDEVQKVPELFSYLQGIVDKQKRPGFYILTGSQNFLMYEKITQSLAGRIAIVSLLPLSLQELDLAGLMPVTVEQAMFTGGYPRLYEQKNIEEDVWLSAYVATYLERDVRDVLKVSNLSSFQKFIKLCAARIGNLINFSDLARDCDISSHTAKSWLSILEASYLIKLVYPYHNNFSKRIVKSPKLYFYDVGLACYLLGINSSQDLFHHPMRGPLFESLIIIELYKAYFNQAVTPQIYFWSDAQNNEIDCIIETGYEQHVALEIKAGMTFQESFLKGIKQWQKITKLHQTTAFVVYSGDRLIHKELANVIPWNKLKEHLLSHDMFKKLHK